MKRKRARRTRVHSLHRLKRLHKFTREFSAGFILFRRTPGGIVFLLLDYGAHWDYAKGKLEKEETPWQAAVRELHEETGIRQVRRVAGFQRELHYTYESARKGHVVK